MSSAGSQAAAVVEAGKCERKVIIGDTTHVVMHSWRPRADRGCLELITKLVDPKHPNMPTNKQTMSVEPTDNALASAAEKMAHKILKRKRDNFQRTQQAGGSSSGRKRRSADGTVVATADPVLKALRLKGSRRTRSGGETNPPVQQQVRWREVGKDSRKDVDCCVCVWR